jgi:hypothetical protein
MDTTWIQVFVLTLSECVAPAGKTVCQENEIEMQFLSKAECEVALQELVSLKDQFDNVIVNRQKSGCSVSARESKSFASLEDAKAASNSEDWREVAPQQTAASLIPHSERLQKLQSCEDSLWMAPCKNGDIIVESTIGGREVEVWRSQE